MKNLSFRHVALGAANSDRTGAPWYVGDFRQLSVSIQSSTASASLYTLVGSNADGFRSALPDPSPTGPLNGWSWITALPGQGLYNFDPGALGFRWLNVYRDAISVSAASNATVTFAGRM